MNSPWSFITKRFAEPSPAILLPSLPEVAAQAATDPARQTNPLDSIGQRDELLRVRMSEMAERLEDLKSLGEDFAQLLSPMEVISSELPYAKARVLELEVLLNQEVDSSQSLRREVDSLGSRVSTLSSELSSSQGRAGRLETALRERETSVEELRLSLREKSLLADELERQVQAESTQAQSLGLEVKSLRSEMQAGDQALIEAERRLAEQNERRNLAEHEMVRLQKVAEEMSVRLLAGSSRVAELEQSLEDSVQAAAGLEIQLASEQAAHQRTQSQADAELTAVRTERSNLAMKVESLSARQTATEQILGQVRAQLREKEDGLRASERTIKEGVAAKAALDSRLEAAREEIDRRDASGQDAQRARSELEDRCEMLTKALSAKDSALESASAKSQHLADRVDSLTLRYEKERQGLEAANRRLLEELQNEKAERTLAQGALDIARESRLSLQRQNEALKRAARARQGEREPAAESDAQAGTGTSSNVSIFPGERKGDETR